MIANHSYRRRGGTYLVVLGGSMLVTVIGLSAVMATRISRKTNEGLTDFMQARLYARSAIEMGFFEIGNNANWRSAPPTGPWTVDDWGSHGSFSLSVTDPDDGNVADSPTDPVLLTGTGDIGVAQYELQVRLEARTPPLSCLEVSLLTGSNLVFDDSAGPITVTGNQILAANNTIQAAVGSATVDPDMEAVNGFSGTLGPGTMTAGVPLREMPDEATVFSYYEDEANGTLIDSLNLPGDASIRRLQGIVLSPNSNPYGPTDPNGVYRIDCRGSELYIADCRIVGTLVLMNASPTTLITNSVNWEPAVSNYPALLMRGSMRMWQNPDPLDEIALGVNFNPPGTPYQGSEDGLLDDQYPSVITGLVYVSGDLSIPASFTHVAVNGVLIVGNTFTLQSTNSNALSLDLTYDQRYYDNPPPGFTEPVRMLIAADSWRRITNP